MLSSKPYSGTGASRTAPSANSRCPNSDASTKAVAPRAFALHSCHVIIGIFRCPLFRGPLIISLDVFVLLNLAKNLYK